MTKTEPNQPLPQAADSAIPEGWSLVPISDVAQVNPRHPKGLDDSMPVSFMPMAALNEDSPIFACSEERPYGEVRKGFTHFREGDVLFAKITPCMENGKGAVATGLRNGIGCGTTELHVLRPLGGIDPMYLYRFLSQRSVRRDAVETFTSSAGQARVPTRFIEELEIPLPPLAEQKRIVAKVEELLARVNTAREHLAKVPAILKRFRQSVLYVACSKGAKTRLGDLLLDIKYGTAKKCTFEPKGTPVLRIPNIADKGVDHDYLKYCVLEDAEIRRLALQNGDLLMIRSNGSVELLGRTTLVTESEKGFAYAGYLMRLRADTKRVMPAYLNLCLRSQECRDQIEMPARSTSGVNNINSQEVRNLTVMIPSLPVQHEIIRRVDALFTLADSIEKQVTAGTARVEKLTQAILAKAFRGELVPQDPKSEPASVLLDPIRVARRTETNKTNVRHGVFRCAR